MNRSAVASDVSETNPAARRTRAGMTIATRATLIGIARRIFGQHGYSAISLEDITNAAHLTRGALYHHFGSKSGLFCAVVDDIDDQIDRMFRGRLAMADGAPEDHWKPIRIASHCFLETVQDMDIRQILIRDAPNYYANFAGRQTRLHCRQSTVDAMQALVAEGKIRVTSAEAAAFMIEGAIAGLVEWASDSEASLIEVRTRFDQLLESLAAG